MMKEKLPKMLLLILLISAIPRIVFIYSVLMVDDGNVFTLVKDDEFRYCQTAAWMAGKLSDLKFKSMPRIKFERFGMLWDVPLYPMFLSIFFRIFQPNYLLAIFLSIILFGLASCLLYLIGVLLLGNRAGLYATIIFSFFPTLFVYSLHPKTEPLFLVFFLSAFYSFILFLRSDRNRYLILTAFFLGLSTLTKEVMVFFIILIAIFIVLKYTIHWKQAIKTVSLLMIIYMAVLSPLIMYNYRKSGHFAISGKVLAYTNFLKEKIGILKTEKYIVASNKKETSSEKIGNLFLNILDYFYKRRHFFGSTGTTVLLETLGYDVSELSAISESKSPKLFLATLKKFGWGWIIFQYCTLFFVGYVYISSFFALLFLIMRRKLKEVISFLLILLYFLAAYFYHDNVRYFIPVIPFLSILSAYFSSIIKGINFKKANTNYAIR